MLLNVFVFERPVKCGSVLEPLPVLGYPLSEEDIPQNGLGAGRNLRPIV